MHILILGGTQFIGRHMVGALLTAGHRVSVFNRGASPDELPLEVERLHGDRNDGIAGIRALEGRTWDVCIDVSGYTAQQVRPSAELLHSYVQRYIFVSSVSVYTEDADRPVRESHPRLPPATEDVTEITGETYGPLKVTCENIVHQVYGERATILRPQVVAGPHDPTGRYPYWVQRATQGGDMLAPGNGTDIVQVIDVRDLAQFTRTVVENDLAGCFNLAGPRITWAEFMRVIGAKQFVWVGADVLEDANLTVSELPLFRPNGGAWSNLMDVSSEQAQAKGLQLTAPETTATAVREWLKGHRLTLALAPEREQELIRIARQQGA